MDINSLLSPQESPAVETPPPQAAPSSASPLASPKRHVHRPAVQQRKSSTLSHHVARSPLSLEPQLPSQSPTQAQQTSSRPPYHPGPQSNQHFQHVASHDHKPPTSGWQQGSDQHLTPSHPAIRRHASTPGMDTLADLASMQQHHQRGAQSNSSGSQLHHFQDHSRPSSIAVSIPGTPHNTDNRGGYVIKHIPRPLPSRSVSEMTMSDHAPASKVFNSSCLSQDECDTLTQISAQLAANPLNLQSNMTFVDLLHKGFQNHIRRSRYPHEFEFLAELRQGRQSMDRLCSVGEQMWQGWLEDETLLATTIDDRVALMELFGRAVTDEPSSPPLWRLYGDYAYQLWSMAHEEQPPESTVLPAEERMIAKELFKWETVMQIWQSACAKTQWNLAASNQIWDRYTEILILDLARSPSTAKVQLLRDRFETRLLKEPHATWDNTFQMFSSFISRHDEQSYETLMSDISSRAKQNRQNYQHREPFELKIAQAKAAADVTEEWRIYARYLEWEIEGKGVSSFPYINGLFERATSRFPTDHTLWQSYIEFLIRDPRDDPSILAITERACRHCPWCGDLWSHRILAMEAEGKDFHEIEDVKHTATSTGLLDAAGMEELVKVYIAWCGSLRRRAFEPDATEEELDVAEVGLRSALDYVQEMGEKKAGKGNYVGDRNYRLERIYIKFLTQRGDVQGAKYRWQSLVSVMKDNYDFWYRFYIWEMVLWAKFAMRASNEPETQLRTPWEATDVLQHALENLESMDRPEDLIQMYVNHCEQHESLQVLRLALIRAREATHVVARRRERELAVTANSAPIKQMREADGIDFEMEGVDENSKRKREEEEDDTDRSAKRPRSTDVAQTSLAQDVPQRDREHTQVLVRGLPEGTSETRLRQFFRDCGMIKSLNITTESSNTVAKIEFESPEDALYAQTKSAKPFEGALLDIEVGAETTLWVTNYPATADEQYMRDLFHDSGEILEIRFPSLQGNTRRRFCYIQFATRMGAVKATELDGKALEKGMQLVAKISNPDRKAQRHGAMEEGREIYVQNLHWNASEAELKELFQPFGQIERVRIPRKIGNKSKGIAFLDFQDRSAAENAVQQLNGTTLRERALRVEISKPQAKRTMAVVPQAQDEAKPSDESTVNGAQVRPNADAAPSSQPKSSHAARSLALLNIPDTVTAARIEQLLAPFGAVQKLVLRPDHGGAIVEFVEEKSVGVASLQLEGKQFDGASLRIGTVDELLKSKPDFKPSYQSKATNGKHGGERSSTKPIFTSGVVNRPGQNLGRGGRRGGLGFKRTGHEGRESAANTAQGETKAQKSNADFKAMIAGG